MADKRVTVFDFVSNYKKMDACIEAGKVGLGEIQRGIKNPDRQIIICDHVVELKEILDEIKAIFLGGWTSLEDDILRQYYNKPGGKEKIIEKIPYRTWPAIKVHARSIGLADDPVVKVTDQLRSDVKKYYTEEGGIQKLERMYPDIPPHLIRNVAKRMGVRIRKSTPWSNEEDQIIKDNADKPDDEIALLLPGRNVGSVGWRRSQLGFKRQTTAGPWTEEEDEILRSHLDISSSRIQKDYLPHRTVSAIQGRYHQLGLKKEYKSSWDEGKKERFRKIYCAGGIAAVRQSEEFGSLSDSVIMGRARAMNAYSEAPVKGEWSESDERKIIDYINTPIGERPMVKDFAAGFPGRSFYAVQGRIAVLKKRMRNKGGAKCEI